jgi:hypothetical protein
MGLKPFRIKIRSRKEMRNFRYACGVNEKHAVSLTSAPQTFNMKFSNNFEKKEDKKFPDTTLSKRSEKF